MSSLLNNSIIRRARKAGSWYEADPRTLDKELTQWLIQAGDPKFGPAKAIISPHAGYTYCGKTAAHAYKEISPEVSRIFILGPSHHVRLASIALSPASIYETPLGNLNIDKLVYEELLATKQFEQMSLSVDEQEHSLELQLPYLYKVMSKRSNPFTIVPMMVGNLSPSKHAMYGKILSKYLAQPENTFIISSDFCHWGSRFSYEFYEQAWGHIYQSIEKLDKLGMKAIKDLKQDSFESYLKKYRNTICGKHPISVMISAIEHLNNESLSDTTKSRYLLKFLDYSQSSRVTDFDDSSVSYAAASVKQFDSSQELKPLHDIVDV